MKQLRHVEKALYKMQNNPNSQFIQLENIDDIKGVAPVVKFTIQSDPISEVGLNGCQAVDMLEYVKNLFESLNEAFPCKENEATLNCLNEGIYWQHKRTEDRLKRQVEGKNLK